MVVRSVDEYLQEVDPVLYGYINKDMYVELATGRTSSTFGDYMNYAIALRASHEYNLAQGDQNATGLVTGRTEGRVSITYWNSIPKGSNSTLVQTKNGKKLKELMTTLGLKATVGTEG